MRPVSIFLLAGLVALASQRFTVTEQLVSSIVGELSLLSPNGGLKTRSFPTKQRRTVDTACKRCR